MANYYKCQILWNLINRGWTETFYLWAEGAGIAPNNGQIPQNAENFSYISSYFKEKIVTPRALLSGKQAVILGTRVSGINRQIEGETPNDGSYLDYANMPKANNSQDCDNPPSVLVTTLYDANTRNKHQIHLRGIWDSVDIEGGQLTTDTNFGQVFQSFATAVTKPGWGWPSRKGTNKKDVTGYVINQNGSITFTLDGNLFDLLSVGTVQAVRVSSLNFGRSNLNGELTVKVNTQSSCTTTEKIATSAFLEQGSMRWNPASWKQNALCQPTKIGSRDTGASIFLGVGRAKKRVRY